MEVDREANLSLVAVRCSTVQHVLGESEKQEVGMFQCWYVMCLNDPDQVSDLYM